MSVVPILEGMESPDEAQYLSIVEYRATFKDNAGMEYICDICRNYGGVMQELSCVATASPLIIRHSSEMKMTPIVDGKCDITLWSDEDRRFTHLYSISGYDTLLVVWRDRRIYWVGTIDPEQYSEPYSKKSNYPVNLTFNDLSMLKRLKFNMTGTQTIKSIIETLVEQSYRGIDREWTKKIPKRRVEFFVSTSIKQNGAYANSKYTLENVYVDTMNFYEDKDGRSEGMTSYDVLASILSAFRLRIEQRAGTFYVYDINSLCDLQTRQLEAKGADAELSADRVYNNISITVKTNEKTELFKSDDEFKGYDIEWIFPNIDNAGYTNHRMYLKRNAGMFGGYRFRTMPETRGNKEFGYVMYANPSRTKVQPTNYKDILPRAFGESRDAKLDTFTGMVRNRKREESYNEDNVVLDSDKIMIPQSNNEIRANYYLGLSLDLFVSFLYSLFQPFNDKNAPAWKKEQNKWKVCSVWLFLDIIAYNGDTPVGRLVIDDEPRDATRFNYVEHIWKPYNSGGHVMLQYRGSGGLTTDTWAKPNSKTSYSSSPNGDNDTSALYGNRFVFPFPTMDATHVQVKVYKLMDISMHTYKAGIKDESKDPENVPGDSPTYVLLKDLRLELVPQDGRRTEASDIALKAWINKDAFEEFSETIVLTTDKDVLPTSLALLRDKDLNRIYSTLRSNGIDGTLEELYINTAYSAYGDRHNVIKGTYNPQHSINPVIIEDKRYMVLEDEFDARYNQSVLTMVEIEKDVYNPNRIEI